MRFLITSDSDACSQMHAPVARELLDRGHEVDVGCVSTLSSFTIEFTRRGIPVASMREVLAHSSFSYDMALCHREPLTLLRHHKVRTAHILTMISDEHRHPAAMYAPLDLMLVGGVTHERNLRRAGYKGTVVRTGMPKYDALHDMVIRRDPLILVPDSPSIPMGKERRMLFETLVEVATRFPHYQVLVKPRFLWKERWRDETFLHGIDEDICLVARRVERDLGGLPPNLEILDHYVPNEELIARAGLVLCVQTGAVLPQMALGKPALIIQDLLHPECCQYESEFRSLRTYLLRSGCVIWLRELFDHLPDGLMPDRSFVEEEIGAIDGRSAKRVADAMEQTADGLDRSLWWVPALPDGTDYGKAVIEYGEKVAAMDPRSRLEEVRKNMKRQALQALQTAAMVFREYAEDLEFELDANRYAKAVDGLFDLPLEEEELNALARKIMGLCSDLVDRAMAYRQGRRYVQNNCRQTALNAFHRLGLHLAETMGWDDRARDMADVLHRTLDDEYLREAVALAAKEERRNA